MKSYGDIPHSDRERVKELTELETWFRDNSHTISSLSHAKGLTCLAHDYYDIDMEEEGYRVLLLAEKHHSGYFKGPIYEDMEKDESFKRLVKQIKTTIGLGALVSLGFTSE